MKPAVVLKHRCFYIHQKPLFINAGEIHYFRIPAKNWASRIQSAKEAGLNTISSYIPWRWHEPHMGQFSFNSKSPIREQNLIRFIKTIHKAGLYFFPRIGPISNAELTREGLPDWLIEGYDDVRVKKQDGENLPHHGLPSLMHPTFQKYVNHWYKRVIKILKPFFIEKQGPIFIIQLCNEIGMVNWCARTGDYNPHTTLEYRKFLSKKFHNDISLLNKSYKTKFKSFDDICQPEGEFDNHHAQMFWDWSEFYREFYALYYQTLYNLVRENNVDLPVSANIPQFWDYNMCARADQGVMTSTQYKCFYNYVHDVILGGAYQMRRLDFENFHDTIVMTEMARMYSSSNAPISCAEMQVGGMNDRPRIYPSDVELNLKSTVGHGVNSINGYMFAGGVNWRNIGCRGTYHEWQAPVTSDGKKRSHFETIKQFGEIMKMWGSKIAPLETVHDVHVGFYPLYYETEYMHGDYIDNLTRIRDRFFFDGILRLLQVAGYNYSLVDISKNNFLDPERIPVLWTFVLDFMDRKTQKRLVEYVNKGGRLILYPTLPEMDTDFSPCTVLADGLGLSLKKRINTTIVNYGKKDIFLDAFYPVTTVDIKGEAKITAKVRGLGACGLVKKIGKGKLIYAGYGITHYFDYHIAHVDELTSLMGVKRSVETSGYDVHAVLRMNGESGFLFLCNYNDDTKVTKIKINFPLKINLAAGRPVTLPNRSAWILPIEQALTDQIHIVYSTAEITKVQKKGKNTVLSLCAPRDAESMMKFRFQKIPRRFLVDGKKPKKISVKGRVVEITFVVNHPAHKAELTIVS